MDGMMPYGHQETDASRIKPDIMAGNTDSRAYEVMGKGTCHGCGDDFSHANVQRRLAALGRHRCQHHPTARHDGLGTRDSRTNGKARRQREGDSDAVTDTSAWKSLPLETL